MPSISYPNTIQIPKMCRRRLKHIHRPRKPIGQVTYQDLGNLISPIAEMRLADIHSIGNCPTAEDRQPRSWLAALIGRVRYLGLELSEAPWQVEHLSLGEELVQRQLGSLVRYNDVWS